MYVIGFSIEIFFRDRKEHSMDYSNSVENAFYLVQEIDEEVPVPLEFKEAKRWFLYEWDDEQQKVIGKWIEQEKT